MKKIMQLLAVSAVVILSVFTLVACATEKTDISSNIGDKLPTGIKVNNHINSNMNALEMYEVGVKNFNDMNYVGTLQKGNISSSAAGLFNVQQTLNSTRIKDNGKYYLDAYTITQTSGIKVDFIDQSVYENGKYRVRSAEKIKVDSNGVGSASQWGDVEVFDSLKSGLEKYPNDPTRINMYIINENTIKSMTKPVYDAKYDQYKFTLVLDCDAATKDYIKNMYYNTKKNSFVKDATITFTSLKLEVVMWSNGLIKSVTNDENYDLSKMGTKTNNYATTYFTYNSNELQLKDYIQF